MDSPRGDICPFSVNDSGVRTSIQTMTQHCYFAIFDANFDSQRKDFSGSDLVTCTNEPGEHLRKTVS